MPHITFEYTNNIENFDFKSFFEELKNEIVATKVAESLGVKCRAVSCSAFYLVDGNENYKMVNLLFRLREGRTIETKQMISKIGLNLLEKYFEKEILAKEIILSTEIKELITGIDLLKNSIR